jgi:hypothetical protein
LREGHATHEWVCPWWDHGRSGRGRGGAVRLFSANGAVDDNTMGEAWVLLRVFSPVLSSLSDPLGLAPRQMTGKKYCLPLLAFLRKQHGGLRSNDDNQQTAKLENYTRQIYESEHTGLREKELSSLVRSSVDGHAEHPNLFEEPPCDAIHLGLLLEHPLGELQVSHHVVPARLGPFLWLHREECPLRSDEEGASEEGRVDAGGDGGGEGGADEGEDVLRGGADEVV